MNKTILISILIISVMLSLHTCATTKPISISSKKSQDPSLKPKVEFSIDSSDVELYYSVIDQAQADGVEMDGQYLYDHYLSKGSQGLRYSYNSFVLGVEKFMGPDADPLKMYWESFQKNMEFLAMNRGNLLKNRYLFTENDLEYAQQQLQSLLDEDFSSTFYFIIGDASTGGTAFDEGIMVDLSMVYNDENDYSAFSRPDMVDGLPRAGNDTIFLFVHEIMHQLQLIYIEKENLDVLGTYNTISDFLLSEGGGHFLADFLLGEEFRPESFFIQQYEYYQDNPQVMADVLAAKDSSASGPEDVETIRRWFFNYKYERANDEPSDMGYLLGALICRDYYDRAEDKKKAFMEIVRYWEHADKIIASYREANQNN